MNNKDSRKKDFASPIRLTESRTRLRSYQTKNLASSREMSGSTVPAAESPQTRGCFWVWMTPTPDDRLSEVDSYRDLRLAQTKTWDNLHTKRSDCSTWSSSMSRGHKQRDKTLRSNLVLKKQKNYKWIMSCLHYVIVKLRTRHLLLILHQSAHWSLWMLQSLTC